MAFNSFIKQTEINSAGGVRITVYKQALGPDGQVMAEVPHQITIAPGDDFAAVIAANNAHLEQMGFPAIDADELALPASLRTTALDNPKVQERIADAAQKAADAAVDAVK